MADRIESALEVPCQVIVAASEGPLAATVRQVASETNCDLIAVPYETEDGGLSPFIERLLDTRMDVLVHQSYDGRTEWRRVTVPVRRASDTAHSMIDFALRLAGPTGRVSVARCIDSENQRRAADAMLANLVETLEGTVETRVARASIERFLARIAPTTDLVIIGASRDRSAVSRWCRRRPSSGSATSRLTSRSSIAAEPFGDVPGPDRIVSITGRLRTPRDRARRRPGLYHSATYRSSGGRAPASTRPTATVTEPSSRQPDASTVTRTVLDV